MFNKNELVIDRVRSLTYHDLNTGKMLLRLTSLEDSSLSTTAETEEIVDAVGAPITTLYRAKRAEFSASNSLFSTDLAAVQFGSEKEVAGTENVAEIIDYTYEVLTVKNGKVALENLPTKTINEEGEEVLDVPYIYTIVNNEIGASYVVGADPAKEFTIAEADKVNEKGEVVKVDGAAVKVGEITVPTEIKDGEKVFVEYKYAAKEAIRVRNIASEFPEAGSLIIYVYFRDKCNDALYSGKVICKKAKVNIESIELALTSTGKHPVSFQMLKDYCSEEGEDELFSIVVSA